MWTGITRNSLQTGNRIMPDDTQKITADHIKPRPLLEIRRIASLILREKYFVAKNAEEVRVAFGLILAGVIFAPEALELIGALGGPTSGRGLCVNGTPILEEMHILHKDDIEPLRAEVRRMEEALGLPCD